MTKAFTYLPGIVWCLLSVDITTQLAALGIMSIAWTYFGIALNQPTNEERQKKHQRLEQALERTGDSGLTEKWYIQWCRACIAIETFTMWSLLVSIIVMIQMLYPRVVMETIPLQLEHQWDRLMVAVPDRKELFVVGLFMVHFYPFWAMATFYALMDVFKNTKLFKPWKIQSDERLTFLKYVKCIAMALLNQMIAYQLLRLIPYNLINPDMFSQTLPSAATAILSLGTYAVAAELWFYSFHRLFHKYDFLYNTFHAQHHSISAPTSIAAIYAHPVEHIVVNFPTLCLGPIVCGSHFSLWLLWSFLATISTCHGHSGWHLPFLGSCESHDFHHSYGTENFGTLGIMDKLFDTQKIWNISANKKVDKTYTLPDYPVDKILANEKLNVLESHL